MDYDFCRSLCVWQVYIEIEIALGYLDEIQWFSSGQDSRL